ncbi:MAG: hypothetical protein JXA21_05200 [Anaerolineae bacterium]|nr:hypothetical protein [Anaerolineae bacterium]
MKRKAIFPPALLWMLLLAFALRIAGLADHNFWWDEGIGVWLARMPLIESIRWTAGDVHPPLYYGILYAWRQLAGEGEFVLRFPSMLFSFLTVPLIYRLGMALARRSKGSQTPAHHAHASAKATGLLAALLLTLSRFSITWAQEVRMYALSALLATGTLWAAVWLWRGGKARAWLLYVVTTLGCLYSLYLTVTVPLVANLGFLVAWLRQGRPRRRLISWLAAQAAVAALFLPWLIYALPRMHSWSSDSAFSPGFFVQLYATMLATGSPINLEMHFPWVVAVFGVLALGIALLLRSRRTSAQSGALAMLLAGLILPALAVLAVSLPFLGFYFSRPLTPRYLLPLSACFYALLAWGLAEIAAGAGRWRRPLAMALTGVVTLTAILGLLFLYPGRARRDDYATIAEVLAAQRHPGDRVLLYVDRDWPIFVAHYAGARDSVPYGMAVDDASVAALLAPLWDSAEGIWLVTTPEALQTDPQQRIPQWLEAHALQQASFVSGENSLTFYVRTEARAQAQADLAPDFVPPQASQKSVGDGQLLGATLPLPRYRTGDTLHLALYWSPPPLAPMFVMLEGPASLTVTIGVVTPAPHTTTRQQVDLPLPPDLPGGHYRIYVQAGAVSPVAVADFTLVRAVAGADIALADVPFPTDYRLGEVIRLVGYDLPRATLQAGEMLELTLYWQTQNAIPTRYKVFTHLLGETYNANTGNFIWGQLDNEPGDGQALTTLWTPGAIVKDGYLIPVDPAAPPGTYTLEIGMYGLVDMTRLPVSDGEGQRLGDAIHIAVVEIQ